MIPHSSFPAFFGTHLKIAQQWILLDRIWHKIKRKKLVDGRLEYFLVVLCLLQSSIEGKRFADCGSYGNWLGRDAVCLVPISSLLRFQRHIIRKQNGSLFNPPPSLLTSDGEPVELEIYVLRWPQDTVWRFYSFLSWLEIPILLLKVRKISLTRRAPNEVWMVPYIQKECWVYHHGYEFLTTAWGIGSILSHVLDVVAKVFP